MEDILPVRNTVSRTLQYQTDKCRQSHDKKLKRLFLMDSSIKIGLFKQEVQRKKWDIFLQNFAF